MMNIHILFRASNDVTYCVSFWCSTLQEIVDSINDGLAEDIYGYKVKDGTILSITFS